MKVVVVVDFHFHGVRFGAIDCAFVRQYLVHLTLADAVMDTKSIIKINKSIIKHKHRYEYLEEANRLLADFKVARQE